jgi:hypothetical protein
MTSIYFDNSATTALSPAAKLALIDAADCYGNPSSLHREGRAAAAILNNARTAIATSLGLRRLSPGELVFTSCGSEANSLAILGTAYLMAAWIAVMLIPRTLIGIFSEDAETITQGARMLGIYFFGFVFMAFQFSGQTTFQALGKAKHAIFFSLLRKVIIVVPLTLLLPGLGFGVEGVFLAEPISNLIGGLAAFITMWITVYRKL